MHRGQTHFHYPGVSRFDLTFLSVPVSVRTPGAETVDQRNKGIHDKNGKTDALRIISPDTDDCCNKSAAAAENNSAPVGHRRSYHVRRHENGSDQHTSRYQMKNRRRRHPGEKIIDDPCRQSKSSCKTNGDSPVDQIEKEQHCSPQQQSRNIPEILCEDSSDLEVIKYLVITYCKYLK